LTLNLKEFETPEIFDNLILPEQLECLIIKDSAGLTDLNFIKRRLASLRIKECQQLEDISRVVDKPPDELVFEDRGALPERDIKRLRSYFRKRAKLRFECPRY
jgi:hypothetical protein